MTDVIALSNFDHNGIRKRGAKFNVSPQSAKNLADKGLVRVLNGEKKLEDDKKQDDGKKSSASPADQASKQKTAKKSDDGEKQTKTEALL